MIIQRRPRPQLRRQLTALAVTGAVLYLVGTTAASPSARSALETVGQRGELALELLRAQLGDARREDALPASVSLAIGQSPVLLSSQEAVLRLRGTEEPDDSHPDRPRPEQPSQIPPPPAPHPEAPPPPSGGARPAGDASCLCGQRRGGQNPRPLLPGGLYRCRGRVHQQPHQL